MAKNLQCLECPKLFKTITAREQHCNAKYHRLPKNSAPPAAAVSTPVVTVGHLVQPPRHVGQRPPAECLLCQKEYKSINTLREHIAATHSFGVLNSLRTVEGTVQYFALPTYSARAATPFVRYIQESPRSQGQNVPQTATPGVRSRSNSPADSVDDKNRCPICRRLVENKSQHYSEAHPHLKCDEFERHVRDAPDHNSRTLCSASSRSHETIECCQNVVRCHVGNHHAPAECPICQKEYRAVDVSSEHIEAVHQSGGVGVLGTANGVMNSCPGSGPSASSSGIACPLREESAGEISPDRLAASMCEDLKPIKLDVPSTPKTAEGLPINTPDAVTVAEAGVQDKSGPTREEDASHTEGSLAAPGGRERHSSLVASDSDSWSEFDGVSDVDCVSEVDCVTSTEADMLSDFVSVGSDDQDGGGSRCKLASQDQEESGTDPESDEECERLMASYAVAHADRTLCEPSVTTSYETSQNEADAAFTVPMMSQAQSESTSPGAWICKVCNNALASPMVTMCGHVFCRGCIIAEISKNCCCPTCKHPILVEIKM